MLVEGGLSRFDGKLELHRVELVVLEAESVTVGRIRDGALEETAVRRSGGIVALGNLGAIPEFLAQLHDRLQEVHGVPGLGVHGA